MEIKARLLALSTDVVSRVLANQRKSIALETGSDGGDRGWMGFRCGVLSSPQCRE